MQDVLVTRARLLIDQALGPQLLNQAGLADAMLLIAQSLNPTGDTISPLLVATGSAAADALQLTYQTNIVTSCAAGAGVKLPVAIRTLVVNRSGATVTVYPPDGGSIEGQASEPVLDGVAATFLASDSLHSYAT